MRFLAAIEDTPVIERILGRIGEWSRCLIQGEVSSGCWAVLGLEKNC
jgi:hypothetical protein